MANIVNWKDEYHVSGDRIVLTNSEAQIPGIRIIARHKIKNAMLPLLPHYHEGAYEFTLITEGKMSFYTNKREYTVSGNCVFVSFPDEVHSTNNTPITLNQQYWIQLDVTDNKNILFLSEEASANLVADLSKIDQRLIQTDDGELRHALKKAFDICCANGNRRQAAAYIHIFLETLIAASLNKQDNVCADIDNALSYLEEHIEEDLQLADLADFCHLSTSRFKQKFRRVVGTAPRHYINEKKITRAKKLLKEGKSVTDVAMQLNFNNSSYFATVFKKYALLTPTQYAYKHLLGGEVDKEKENVKRAINLGRDN